MANRSLTPLLFIPTQCYRIDVKYLLDSPNLSLIVSFLMFSSLPLLSLDFVLGPMKQVEIKRTIPKGAGGNQSKDIKTKKIFVGGIPSAVTEGIYLPLGTS